MYAIRCRNAMVTPTPVGVIVAVHLSKALKDAHSKRPSNGYICRGQQVEIERMQPPPGKRISVEILVGVGLQT